MTEMDSLVANTSNSISRNKRKFRSDPTLRDTSKFDSSSHNNLLENPFQNTEPVQTKDNTIGSLGHDHLNLYDSDDWNDLTETQLQNLIFKYLETIFKCAIKNIIACGYTEEVVNSYILMPNIYDGPNDIVSNIVNNTLWLLQKKYESKEHFENLQQLERYMLAELVCMVREARPDFSNGDALWGLLLCDMNATNACKLEDRVLTNSQPPQVNSNTEKPRSEFCFSASSKRNSVSPISLTGNGLKTVCTRKIAGVRQKSFHVERASRRGSSKGSSRSGKFNSFGRLVLDKKSRSLSESKGITIQTATVKMTKGTDVDKQRMAEASTGCVIAQDTEFREDTQNDSTDSDDKPLEMKTEIDIQSAVISRLAEWERALNMQLKKWDEWANRKVMQVAKRLVQDKAERKVLLEERDEAERVRNEKQALEENTTKKLSEMESNFCKLSKQMEWAGAVIKRLEEENKSLMAKTDEARKKGEEAVEKCREGVNREKEAASKAGKWDKERGLFQDELVVAKRRVAEMAREVELAKVRKDQAEARWKQEEKAKEKFLKETHVVKARREELEASIKSQVETIKANAETNLKKYNDEIKMLERDISLLRLKKDSSKIAALKQGNIEHVDPKKKAGNDDISTKVAVDFEDQDYGVERERECVMCLSEEMSVVFLPCAHQVVCSKCNELHEKQGMKDCPSCRCPIQERITVRYA